MLFPVVAVGFVVNLKVLGCTTALALVAIALHHFTPYRFPVGGGEEALVRLLVGLALPYCQYSEPGMLMYFEASRKKLLSSNN